MGVCAGEGGFERNKGGSRGKWGRLERKSACIFRTEWGRERKTPAFLFSTSAKVEIRANSKQKLPVKLIFSVQNEILDEKIQCREEKNTPKSMVFAPKVAESGEKGRFGGGNHREGMKRKNGLNCRFCNAMK